MTKVIRAEKIIEEDVRDALNTENQYYLLLENDHIDLYKMIKSIDFYTHVRFLWENTFLDEHKEESPFLIQFDKNSLLIEAFIKIWTKENLGILIESSFSPKQLQQHLQSILLVRLPDGTQARFNLHEPRKLAGVLNALETEERYQSLLRPIKTLYWQENCGTRSTWYQAKQANSQAPIYTHNDMRWFMFNKEEIKQMDEHELSYLSCELISELELNDDFMKKLYGEDIKEYVNRGIKNAHRLQLYKEENIKHYLLLCATHPHRASNQEFINIIVDTKSDEDFRLSQLEKLINKKGVTYE